MPKNNSYFIAITIPEPLNSKIEIIKKNVSKKYRTKSVLKSPPHITVIPPFFWGNEEELLMMLEQFSFPQFNIYLNGYSTFPLSVVYINVQKNEQLDQLHTSFNDVFYSTYPQLKKIPLFPFHPHITVGNRGWKKEQFNQCWDDLKDEHFKESFLFRKLSLLKNINGLWRILPSG